MREDLEQRALSQTRGNYDQELSVSDLHIVRELRLANENLKLRLREKDTALDNAGLIIARLSRQNEELLIRVGKK